MGIKKNLFSFFYIYYWQKLGIICFIGILFILIIIKIIFYNINLKSDIKTKEALLDDTVFIDTERVLNVNNSDYKSPNNSISKIKKSNLFYFDPNTINDSCMLVLGFNSIQIKTVNNYRNKGGRYYNANNFSKMYNFTSDEIALLLPFIDIPQKKNISFVPNNIMTSNIYIELNSADSIQLIEVKGIGPIFAKRIIKYRNILGGFNNIEQLKEVYGIDSLFYALISPQIYVDSNLITKININTADYSQLSKHPYINSKQANIIINYRKFHGNYYSMDDLIKSKAFADSIDKRLLPYLNVE